MKSIVDAVNKLGKDAGFTSSVVITSAAASLAAYQQSSPVYVDIIIPEKCTTGQEGVATTQTRMSMILAGNAACVDINGCAGGNKCSTWAGCKDVKAPGTGFKCGACPSGMKGDGKKCAPAACARGPTDPPAGPCGWEAQKCTDISQDLTKVAQNASQMYTCTCKPGSMSIGGKCVKVSGTCSTSCAANAACYKTAAGDTCVCKRGLFKSPSGGALKSGEKCSVLDGCARSPCFPGVACTSKAGKPTCKHSKTGNSCPPGAPRI